MKPDKKTDPTRSSQSNRAASRHSNLLIELGTEELPPKALKTLASAFASNFTQGLVEAGVLGSHGLEASAAEGITDNYRYFATPRRLAVLVYAVTTKQPDRVEERRGPALQAAYDDQGKPTRAAEGFARSCGVEVARLETIETDQGAWLVYRKKVAGAKLVDIVTHCLEQSVRQLPIPKRMRWGDSPVEFVRPVHWLLALHGPRVIKTEVLGLKADRYSRGHRFHAPDKLRIPDADAYAGLLETDGKVIADFMQRQKIIRQQLARLGKKSGARVAEDAELLDLVTGLVEWPQALLGEFDRRFLKIPGEVLISSMRDHQKYFHLTDDKGNLLPCFITVSNIRSKSPARVRQGNERVLRARLADAEFFWNSDLKIPLIDRTEQLKGVLFHKKLGSIHHKTERVVQLARLISDQLHADQLDTDTAAAGRAALLCKADLVTDMVGEFPELQGTIGRHYARKSGEDKAVADAIEQHYWPRYAGDKLPGHPVAQSVALADRIDSLVGIFAAGEIPSGDRDPFALRRAALGVLRILIEKKLDLDLYGLLQASRDTYAGSGKLDVVLEDETIDRVFEFMLDRLKAWYQPMGYSVPELASVMACRPRKPLDFDLRLKALSRFFKKQPAAAESLAAANKRIANILSKAGGSQANSNRANSSKADGTGPAGYDESLFREKAEAELARQLDQVSAVAQSCFAENRYDKGFAALSKLKQPIDRFFDEVMVMDEDVTIRNNRLALLHAIRQLFLGVADISFMQVV